MYVVCTLAHSPSTYITSQVHTERQAFLKEESSVHYGIYPLFYYVCNVKKDSSQQTENRVTQHRWVRVFACVHQSCIPLGRYTLQFELEKLPKPLNLRYFLCKGEELIVSLSDTWKCPTKQTNENPLL